MSRDTVFRLGAPQSIAVTTASQQSQPINGRHVRLVYGTPCAVGAGCRVAFGANPTATATSTLIPPGIPEYFVLNPDDNKIAVLCAAGDEGTLTITETY